MVIRRTAQSGANSAFDALLAARAIQCVYQPIVRLDGLATVGFRSAGTRPDRHPVVQPR